MPLSQIGERAGGPDPGESCFFQKSDKVVIYSVKLSKTGNYQFVCQNREGSREFPGLSAKGVSCKLTCSWSGKLVRACRA